MTNDKLLTEAADLFTEINKRGALHGENRDLLARMIRWLVAVISNGLWLSEASHLLEHIRDQIPYQEYEWHARCKDVLNVAASREGV